MAISETPPHHSPRIPNPSTNDVRPDWEILTPGEALIDGRFLSDIRCGGLSCSAGRTDLPTCALYLMYCGPSMELIAPTPDYDGEPLHAQVVLLHLLALCLDFGCLEMARKNLCLSLTDLCTPSDDRSNRARLDSLAGSHKRDVFPGRRCAETFTAKSTAGSSGLAHKRQADTKKTAGPKKRVRRFILGYWQKL